MIQLTADEARVFGVLIEKALTTPDQYPLSLNAITNGSNQKNNRDPVIEMGEDQAYDAVEGLRAKGLVMRVDTPGSRVSKFRHQAMEKLAVRTGEMAVLAELLLRGPSTQGEIRGRASRMHSMETLDVVRDLLRALSDRAEPLVTVIPGGRAERYAQLLCRVEAELESATEETAGTPNEPQPVVDPQITERVAKLEAEVGALRTAISRLATALGEADPFIG